MRAAPTRPARRGPATAPSGRLPRPDAGRRRAGRRGARRSWPTCARGATPPCASYTERFDGVRPRRPAGAAAERSPPPSTASTPTLRAALEVGRATASDAFHEHAAASPTTPTSATASSSRAARSRSTGPAATCPAGGPSTRRTVLMTAVPARVAGVPEVVLCVPPDRDGHGARRSRWPPPRSPASTRCTRIGGAQAIGAMAYGTESIRPVDVIVGPGQRLRGRRQARGRRRRSACRRRSPARPRSWWSPTTSAPAELRRRRRHRAGRARPRRPGLADHLVDEAVADAVDAAIDGSVAASPRRAEIEATLRRGRLRRRWSTGPSRRSRSPTSSPPSTSSCMTRRPRGAACRCVRHAGAVFCGPWSPASVGDYIAGPEPRAAHRRHPPASLGALTVDDFRKHVHVVTLDRGGARRRSAPHVEAPRRGRGPRRPRRLGPPPRRPAGGSRPWPTASRPATTSRSWRATTRPRSTSTSGSTPTSRPIPPPPAFARRARRRAVARVDWHRYPDRGRHRAARRASARCTASGPSRSSSANGSNEVLQTLLLAYGGAGPHRRRVRADLRAALATSPGSPAPAVADGRAAPTTSRSTSTRCAGCSIDAAPAITFLCSPNNPTGHGRAAEATVRDGARRWRAGPARGRRGLRPVRPVVGARAASTRTRRWSSPARSRRRGRWPPPGSATWSGPTWVVDRAREGRAAVPPRRGQAGRRRARPRLRRRDGGSGSPRWSRSAAGSTAALRELPRRGVAVGRQLRPVPAHGGRRRRGVAGAARPVGARAQLLVVAPASTAACASPSAPPTRTTLPRRPHGGPRR